MKKMFRKGMSIVLTLALMLSIIGMTGLVFAAPGDVTITLLHINDTHGGGVESKDSEVRFSRIPAIKAAQTNPVLIDAGDFSHGGIYCTFTDGGLGAINSFRMAGFDYTTFGNHEFSVDTEKVINRLLNDGGTDDFIGGALLGDPVKVLNGNIKGESGKSSSLIDTLEDLPEYDVKEIDGVKVGFFSLTTASSKVTASPTRVNDLDFESPVSKAQEIVDQLTDVEEVDVIVCIAHLGYDVKELATDDDSYAVAKQVDGIDVIIDGHAHQSLMGSSAVTVDDTMIVSTGTANAALGKVELVYNKTSDSLTSKVSSAITGADSLAYAEDAAMKTYLDGIVTDVDTALGGVIATTSMKLYGGNYSNAGVTASVARRGETNVSNLIAEGRRNAAIEFYANHPELKDLDVIALQCGGGVRNSLNQGDITYKDVMSLFLSGGTGGNTYVKVKGKIIWEIIEWGLSCITGQNPETGALSADGGVHGRFPNFAGINYVWDISKPASDRAFSPSDEVNYPNGWDDFVRGSRVQSVTLDDGTPIAKDSEDWYILVTSSYEMTGGDGYHVLARALEEGDLIELGIGGLSSYEATIAQIEKVYAETGDVYCPLNTGKVTCIGGYEKESFQSTIAVTDKDGALVANRKVAVYVNYGTEAGVKWEFAGNYTTNAEGKIVATLINGPQEVKVVVEEVKGKWSKNAVVDSNIMYVDNYAGLVNSANSFAISSDKMADHTVKTACNCCLCKILASIKAICKPTPKPPEPKPEPAPIIKIVVIIFKSLFKR